MLRMAKLDYATVYPTNFDKQKVRLTVNGFNEKIPCCFTYQWIW